MKLTLVPTEGIRYHGEPFEAVFGYEVHGLPDGHGAYIKNLDHPRNLWSIIRVRNGVPEETPTGNYLSPEDALSVLQDEYK